MNFSHKYFTHDIFSNWRRWYCGVKDLCKLDNRKLQMNNLFLFFQRGKVRIVNKSGKLRMTCSSVWNAWTNYAAYANRTRVLPSRLCGIWRPISKSCCRNNRCKYEPDVNVCILPECLMIILGGPMHQNHSPASPTAGRYWRDALHSQREAVRQVCGQSRRRSGPHGYRGGHACRVNESPSSAFCEWRKWLSGWTEPSTRFTCPCRRKSTPQWRWCRWLKVL